MILNTLSLAALAITGAYAQSSRTTYTGCSTETVDGSAIYGCFGPDGARTPFSTQALSTPASSAAAATGQTTAVTDCTASATDNIQCVNGAGSTVRVLHTATATDSAPAEYTQCHSHSADETFCFSPDGEDVEVVALGAEVTPAPSSGSSSSADSSEGQTTAVTDCTAEATNSVQCVNGAGSTVQVLHTPTAVEEVPAAYTGCHSHGDEELFCFAPDGEDVQVIAQGATRSTERSCHFHGPIEHCVGGDEEESQRDCGMSNFEYDVGLRVGMIFVILVTSGIGVFAPLIITKLPLGNKAATNTLQMLKQFGTGIIISTAFIHLWSHAQLYLSNECIRWPVYYEGTTSAIVMAGLFLSFLIDYIALRWVGACAAAAHPTTAPTKTQPDSSSAASGENVSPAPTNDKATNALLSLDHHSHGNTLLSVTLMEAGILFHSILIGLTLSVTPDSAFRTLLVVIVFHQFFEGLALGARISLLPNTAMFPKKFLMAAAFTLITPIGMAIGIGVLNTFNGNDPSTMVTFGTLNALSAGILLWVGVVDMWARDWVIEGGEMTRTRAARTTIAMLFFVAGLVLMSVLGKWA